MDTSWSVAAVVLFLQCCEGAASPRLVEGVTWSNWQSALKTLSVVETSTSHAALWHHQSEFQVQVLGKRLNGKEPPSRLTLPVRPTRGTGAQSLLSLGLSSESHAHL